MQRRYRETGELEVIGQTGGCPSCWWMTLCDCWLWWSDGSLMAHSSQVFTEALSTVLVLVSVLRSASLGKSAHSQYPSARLWVGNELLTKLQMSRF